MRHQNRGRDSQVFLVFKGGLSNVLKCWACLVFVYIDVASHMNRWVFDGNFCRSSSFLSVKESWKLDFCIFARGYSYSVIRCPKGCKRLPEYDTTGHVLSGMLCTFKSRYKNPHGSSFVLKSVRKHFSLPCLACPDMSWSASLVVFAPNWHDTLQPLGSDVDTSECIQDDIL